MLCNICPYIARRHLRWRAKQYDNTGSWSFYGFISRGNTLEELHTHTRLQPSDIGEILMKAATGELNLTVITMLAIAAVIGFFWLMWPNIRNSINDQWETISNPTHTE